MTQRLSSLTAAAISAVLAYAVFPDASIADHQKIPIEPLAAYTKLDPSGVTVSGISSGAFFAHQFHVAYASLVKGAGIVAGGPYGCADQEDSITTPLGNPFIVAFVPRRVVVSLGSALILGGATSSRQAGVFPTSRMQATCARQRSVRMPKGRSTIPATSPPAGSGFFTATRTLASRNPRCRN